MRARRRLQVSEAAGKKEQVPKIDGVLVENSGRCSTNDAGEKARGENPSRNNPSSSKAHTHGLPSPYCSP